MSSLRLEEPFFYIKDHRNRFEPYTVNFGKISFEISDGPILFPKRNPPEWGRRIKEFNNDKYAGVSFEEYTGQSNCITYALKNIIEDYLKIKKKNGEKARWYDIFISPSDTKTIDYILEEYTSKYKTYKANFGENIKTFANKIERGISKDDNIKSGDILAIVCYCEGKKKYIHMARIDTSPNGTKMLYGKFGPYDPVLISSIHTQIEHYGKNTFYVEVYKPIVRN